MPSTGEGVFGNLLAVAFPAFFLLFGVGTADKAREVDQVLLSEVFVWVRG